MDEAKSTFQRIQTLLERANDPSVDDFIRSHLAQLICVMGSGAIEVACQRVLANHSGKTASVQTARYAKKQLGGFQNPNPKKIKELFSAFDENWGAKLDAYWLGEVKDSVGSLVGNRHLISHGKNTNVTLAQVKPWIKCAEQLCRKLEEIVGK